MSKTIVVYCGAQNCGAVIAKRVVPNAAAEQAKALVPAVMNCPNAEKKHPEYPAVHTRVEIEAGPKKAAVPAARGLERGKLEPRREVPPSKVERTSPTSPPPPPSPEGATLGMTHLEQTGDDDRRFSHDEMPQGEIPEVLDDEEPGGAVDWSPSASDGSDLPPADEDE